MAALPEIPMPTEKVETPGGPVLVRGLTAAEAVKAQKIWESGDRATFEVTVIAMATDTPKPAAKKWHDAIPAGIVNEVIAVVHRLSGLDEEASKSAEAGTADG
jgi:hypothetical protein